MSTNLKAFVAGIVIIIACLIATVWGYVTYGSSSITWPLGLGVVVVVVDLLIRKAPNPKIMNWARAIGISAGFVLSIFKASGNIGTFFFALCLPLALYLEIATLFVARARPGYWKR